MKKKYRTFVYSPRGNFFSKIVELSEEDLAALKSLLADAEQLFIEKESGIIYFSSKTFSESVVEITEVKE